MKVYNAMTKKQRRTYDSIVLALLLRGYKTPTAIDVAERSILNKEGSFKLGE